jgi:hypothetical protein
MSDAVADHFGWDKDYYGVFFHQQALGENTDAQWNPLATTQPAPGSWPFNDAGVQNFPDMATGIDALIWTLDPLSYNPQAIDYYMPIRLAIVSQSIDAAGRARVAAAVSEWGTTDFAQQIIAGWDVPHGVGNSPILPPSRAEMDGVVDTIRALNSAALARFKAISDAVNAFAKANPEVPGTTDMAKAIAAAADPKKIPS